MDKNEVKSDKEKAKERALKIIKVLAEIFKKTTPLNSSDKIYLFGILLEFTIIYADYFSEEKEFEELLEKLKEHLETK